MYWNWLLVMIALVNAELAVVYKEESPTINNITAYIGNVANIIVNDVTNYRIVGSTSDLSEFANKLFCKASNAEELIWEYKRHVGDAWSTTLPRVIAKVPPMVSNNGLDLLSEINDGVSSTPEQLKHLNGYYRCLAHNNNKKFTSLSPTIRFILPYWTRTTSAVIQLPVQPVEGKPFRINCSGTAGYKLAPDDIDNSDIELRYHWIIKSVVESNYPPPRNHSTRIRIDPLTGDLYFAYMKTTDIFGTNSGDVRLRCRSFLGTYESLPNLDYRLINISRSSEPPMQLDVHYPPSTMTSEDEGGRNVVNDPVICVAGENCTLKCIFSGTDAESNEVHGTVPAEHRNQYQVIAGIGFSFVPVYSANLIECLCSLGSPALKTVVYKVRVLSHPKLADRTFFPKTPRMLETGSRVQVVCNAQHATGYIKLYIHGKEIREASPSYVKYSANRSSTFTIENAQRDHSGSVLCAAKGEAGRAYFTTVFNIYDPPVVTQYPQANNPHRFDSETNERELYRFNCSVKLDLKTTKAEIYWMFQSMSDQMSAAASRAKNGENGVKELDVELYNGGTGEIFSSLTTERESHVVKIEWWCVVDYAILDHPIAKSATSNKVLIEGATTLPVQLSEGATSTAQLSEGAISTAHLPEGATQSTHLQEVVSTPIELAERVTSSMKSHNKMISLTLITSLLTALSM